MITPGGRYECAPDRYKLTTQAFKRVQFRVKLADVLERDVCEHET